MPKPREVTITISGTYGTGKPSVASCIIQALVAAGVPQSAITFPDDMDAARAARLLPAVAPTLVVTVRVQHA